MKFWKETLLGIGGEILLFVFTVMVVSASAAIALAIMEQDQDYASIAMMFAVNAGAVYTARGYYDQREWNKLILTGIVAALISMALLVTVASQQGISLTENLIGSALVLGASAILTLTLYGFRVSHLFSRWRPKMADRKSNGGRNTN